MKEKRSTSKAPVIRFREFRGEWKYQKFEDEVEFYSGLTYLPNDVSENGTLVLRSSNVKNGEIVDADNVYVVSEKVNSCNVKEGDIVVVVRNGSRSLIGKHAQVKKKMDSTVIGAFMTGIRAPQSNFINALLGTVQFSNEIEKNLGATINQITNGMFRDMGFMFPATKEQNRIGIFFTNLDNLITLQQQKYNKLKTIKKAMLEKMFPKEGADVPELRFAGFTGAWSVRTIGEILSIKHCPIEMKDEWDYQLVTVKRRNEGVISRGRLKGKNILVKNYFVIEEGDFLISKRQVVHGANGLVPKQLDKSIVSNEYLVITGNQDITSEFWALISKTRDSYQRFFLSSYGVDIEKLVFDVEDWKKRSITIPTLAEQERICNFFEDLDQHITLQHQKLEKLKNLKSALLEKMFV